MEPTNIIEHYEMVAERCQSMLAYANEGAWEALIVAQGEYVGAVEQLAALERDVALDAATRERKYELLVEIRDAEDRVRALLDARMNQLSEYMSQSRNQLRVSRAYDSSIAN